MMPLCNWPPSLNDIFAYLSSTTPDLRPRRSLGQEDQLVPPNVIRNALR